MTDLDLAHDAADLDAADALDLTTYDAPAGGASPDALASLADVEIEITVELGRRRLSIAELSQLGIGSIIELSTLAGEPVAIFANGRRIATGDVVVVDGVLGVQIVALEGRA